MKAINNELLFDLDKAQKLFGFKKVKLFVSKEAQLYHIAAAYGLYCYINDCMDFECTYVLPKEQWSYLLSDMDRPELPENIKHNQNDFISILIDCKKLSDVSTPTYNDTYLILELCGGRSGKTYGVKGYCANKCEYAAEIIVQCISAYELTCPYQSQRAIGYLYLSLLDYTSNFQSFLTSHLFATMQELSGMDCDFEYYHYIHEKKSMGDLEILLQIYENTKIDDTLAIVTLNHNLKYYQLPMDHFRHCLQFCRYIDNIDLWILLIEDDHEQYEVLLQSNSYNNINLKNIARQFGGVASKKQGRVRINKSELPTLLKAAHNTINLQEKRLKSSLRGKEKDILRMAKENKDKEDI